MVLICPIFNICGARMVALRVLWPGEGGKALRNLRFFKEPWGDKGGLGALGGRGWRGAEGVRCYFFAKSADMWRGLCNFA